MEDKDWRGLNPIEAKIYDYWINDTNGWARARVLDVLKVANEKLFNEKDMSEESLELQVLINNLIEYDPNWEFADGMGWSLGMKRSESIPIALEKIDMDTKKKIFDELIRREYVKYDPYKVWE